MNDTQLQQLIDKLNTTGQAGWEVLVRQAPIQSTVDVIWTAAAVLALYISSRGISEAIKQNQPIKIGIHVLVLLISVVTVIAFFGDVEEIMSGFFNPQYWALHKLLKL